MADTERQAQWRNYLDTVNSQRGINWKQIRGHFARNESAGSLARWLYDTYDMDMNEAQKYAQAAFALYETERSDGSDAGRARSQAWEKSQTEQQNRMGFDYGQLPQSAQPQGPQGPDPRAQLTDRISRFVEALGQPIGMENPIFASLVNMGRSRASQQVGASGVRVGRGGLGELAIQQGVNQSVTPYLQQREQMQMQGLGLLNNMQISDEQLAQGAYQLEMQRQQIDNNAAMQRYATGKDQAGGLGGTFGALGGAALGTILTAATGGAAAPAIPGLISGGSAVGAGWGQMGVQAPRLPSMRPYGGLGNRGYT